MTSASPDDWLYLDTVPANRREKLAESGSFDELATLIISETKVTRVQVSPGRDAGLTDCIQPIFLIHLPATGDAFFNGPFGYRAQYWKSPGTGLGANAELLTALSSVLLASLMEFEVPELGKIDICASLRCASAKIWVLESDIKSTLINPVRTLVIQRWLCEADKGVELATWGVCAPEVTNFEVKGALMDPYGHEVVPERKTRRHFDIFHYGFS